MNQLQIIYRTSLALLTDLYQLTMANGYWRNGVADAESVFHLYFRRAPFKGEYAVSAGLQTALEFLQGLSLTSEDLDYLAEVPGNDGHPIFSHEFLRYLEALQFQCDVDAVPEGRIVFANEPLVRVRGPLVQAQLVETALLTIINFQTLIATKAARVALEAGDDPVLEFGLRRAQGIDGGITASRAAYIGGCSATSNVLAGKLFGIPVKGTHAHSWVMCFEDELTSFQRYADAMPNNCIFLVDTFDTIEGIKHAIRVGRQLQENGHKLVGIRLDSGDFTILSQSARQMLDEAGFHDTAIVGSNDLDEELIRDLKQQDTKINVWGVGTKLATAYDQPALGGVYKLAAIRFDSADDWQYKIKLSEQPIKVSTPGMQQVRRFIQDDRFVADCLFDELAGEGEMKQLRVLGQEAPVALPKHDSAEDLLVPAMRAGEPVHSCPALSDVRSLAKTELQRVAPATIRLKNPTPYTVGLEPGLFERRAAMIAAAQAKTPDNLKE